jgi:hypothetical protein
MTTTQNTKETTMTKTTLICEDCGKAERGGETWTTTIAQSASGRGWCPGCTRLRSAVATCQPTARLREAQKARRVRAGYR